jgi:hypothetical protein
VTGPGAEILGLELDPNLVHIARREIFESSDSFTSEGRIQGKVQIVEGDCKKMMFGCKHGMQRFPPEYFDVINIGVAMPVNEIEVDCLKNGGLLLLPACSGSKDPQVGKPAPVRVKIQATFQAWRKVNGELMRIPISAKGGGSVKCNFISADASNNYTSSLSAP